MAVPSSGQLRLRADINQEINGNNTDDNVSLGTLSNDAGFSEPDTMSEFYGYSSCGTPGFRTTYSSGSINGNIQLYTILDYTPYCNTIEYGLYVGTNSSGPTANTKYQVGTSWGIYQWAYPTVGGFSNNTTYYAWIYATNSAGKTGYSSMQTVTIPPPYMNATFSGVQPFGDYYYYCPDSSWYGGMVMGFTGNNQYLPLTFDVYGGSTFSHSTSPNCLKNYGTYSNFSASTEYMPMEGTSGVPPNCTRSGTSGTTDNLYLKMIASGYSSRVTSAQTTCQ